jgi:hypothetical protein
MGISEGATEKDLDPVAALRETGADVYTSGEHTGGTD